VVSLVSLASIRERITDSFSESSFSYRLDDWRRGFRRFASNKLSLVGLGIVGAFIFMMIFAPWITPYPQDATGAINLFNRLQPPSWAHPFGTDNLGDDILTRCVFATRTTLLAAVSVELLIASIAVPVGMIAAYVGGKVANGLLMISNIFMTIPALMLALAATTVFPPSLTTEIFAAAIAFWPWLARLVYSVVVSVKEEQFIDAAKVAGKKKTSIMFGDIFPHLASVLTVKMTLDTGFMVLFIASLSFLGLGVHLPTADWGQMAATGRTYLPQLWWFTTFPGIFIFIAVLGFSLLGDGLRDYFDVQLDTFR
jgi:peptide/nickel transport system permease protein